MDVHKRTWFLRDFCRDFETQPVVLILMKFVISQQRAGAKNNETQWGKEHIKTQDVNNEREATRYKMVKNYPTSSRS